MIKLYNAYMTEALILKIIFYLLLTDAISVNLISWLGFRKWYQGNFAMIARFFPLTRGWTTYYLTLVLFIGYVLHNYVINLI